MSIRNQIIEAVLTQVESVPGIGTIRKTIPSVGEVTGLQADDFPAVVVSDRGFSSSAIRNGLNPDIQRKDFTLRIEIYLYVIYSEDSDAILTILSEQVMSVLEATQDLGISDEIGRVKTITCTAATRSPFLPVSVEVLDFEVDYSIYPGD